MIFLKLTFYTYAVLSTLTSQLGNKQFLKLCIFLPTHRYVCKSHNHTKSEECPYQNLLALCHKVYWRCSTLSYTLHDSSTIFIKMLKGYEESTGKTIHGMMACNKKLLCEVYMLCAINLHTFFTCLSDCPYSRQHFFTLITLFFHLCTYIYFESCENTCVAILSQDSTWTCRATHVVMGALQHKQVL